MKICKLIWGRDYILNYGILADGIDFLFSAQEVVEDNEKSKGRGG
jgi:hypothetical protein